MCEKLNSFVLYFCNLDVIHVNFCNVELRFNLSYYSNDGDEGAGASSIHLKYVIFLNHDLSNEITFIYNHK